MIVIRLYNLLNLEKYYEELEWKKAILIEILNYYIIVDIMIKNLLNYLITN